MSIDTFLLSSNTTDLNYPEVRPTLDLNFARVKALDPRITFTRASGGSYVGADGLIKLAGVNEARFDHDPYTGESLGLLVEEARTNLFAQSTNSNHSTLNGVSVLDNDSNIIAPNGTTTATRYTPTSPSGTDEHNIAWESGAHTATINHNTDYIFSYFVKPDPNTVALDMGPRVTNHFSNHQLYFQSTLGRVAGRVYDRNSTTESTSAFAIPYPNNWWRVYARVSLSGASTYLFRTGVYLLFNNGSSSWTVTDSSIGRLWMWGWQIEQGEFPTSYIPTEGSSRTRAADNASITGANFSSWYNQNEGTLSANYLKSSSSTGSVFKVSDGTFNNRIDIFYRPSNTNILEVLSGGTTVSRYDFTITLGSPAKQINAYQTNNFNAAYNGTVYTTDTSGAVPTINKALIGSNDTFTEYLNGTIARLTYYPKRLTNAQLQALTR